MENMSTNEESKTQNISQNGNDKSETLNFLESNGPNLVESVTSSKSEGEKESIDGDALIKNEVTSERRENSLENNKNGDNNKSNQTLPSDYENSVLQDSDLLTSEQDSELTKEDSDLDDANMSRQNTKSRLPNKTTSRSALSHSNSKVSGELTGQPSAKSTKEDIKYWKNREQELLNKIAELENRESERECKMNSNLDSLTMLVKDDGVATSKEKENYKGKLQTIEKEMYSKPKEISMDSNGKNFKSSEEIINHLKLQNEDLRNALAKMTSILREKTTMCIGQEKKIAALVNQVESLKEVVAITKDLLNIRNMEVQHLSNDISAMESKIDCERQRHNQMLTKMDEAVKLNTELKKEYENQLRLFQHLRDSYEEKILLLSRDSNSEKKENQTTEKGNANEDSSYSQVQTLVLK